MRSLAVALWVGMAIAGCRSGGRTMMIDPGRSLPECPAGPHLALALQLRDSSADHALLRFDSSLAQCRGVALARMTYASPSAVGGLPDGREVIGFGGYNQSGQLAVVEGDTPRVIAESPQTFPVSFAVIDHGGPMLAVLWGNGSSGSGDHIDLYRLPALELTDTFDASFDHVGVSAPPSGMPDRLGLLDAGDGVQEARLDPGAESLATTGELQLTIPSFQHYTAMHVVGADVVGAAEDGLVYWSRGMPEAFLGPTPCGWAATSTTVLPGEQAEYIGAAHFGSDAIALVRGALEDGADTSGGLYTITRRGECVLLVAIPDTHEPVGMAWSGR
ncbi:MAG: hypothetical protein AB7S26_08195 [Sandaracinaceae bacterium]